MRNWKSVILFINLALIAIVGYATDQSAREAEFYRLETYEMPTELKLEISGMALMPDGRLAVAIRKGEIWIISNAYDSRHPRYKRFASGLHEPLGLAIRDGSFYTVQRTELTRIVDLNGDEIADEYITVAKGWGVTGNYHEYAYGPVFDQQGNAWISLNCSIGSGTVPDDNAWRGWSMMVKPDGTLLPVSGGFRSPCGLGVNLLGDIFVTDQQGNWFPTCPLIHIKPGVFHGHADALVHCDRPGATFKIEGDLPENLTVVEAAERIGPYQLPAVWFPYRKMGMSSSDILCDTTEGKFGPFAGQLFVGEFTQSFVTRVHLEKVKGEYQGACFRFREGMQCAVLRLEWGQDGSMFVGQSNRGWNSLGTRSYGLQRIIPTRKIPFEIKVLSARSYGFHLEFTRPVDKVTATNIGSYSFTSYTYPYHSNYGGDEIDRRTLGVKSAIVSNDGLTVDLEVEGLREGYVHELNASLIRSSDKAALLHSHAYYTLNRIP